MSNERMEIGNGVDLTGFAAAFLGWMGTIIGAMWNLESMQIISFLFAAFAGFGTGIYYLTKSAIEVWQRVIVKREERRRRRDDDDEESDQEEE
jgi:hypothetical protein